MEVNCGEEGDAHGFEGEDSGLWEQGEDEVGMDIKGGGRGEEGVEVVEMEDCREEDDTIIFDGEDRGMEIICGVNELRERGNDEVGKVTIQGDEERDSVEVFEMEGCEEEEEIRGHKVEVGGREIVCGGAYNEDKTKTGE